MRLWAVVKLKQEQGLEEGINRRSCAVMMPLTCVTARLGNNAPIFADPERGEWGVITDHELSNTHRWKIGQEGAGGHVLMIFFIDDGDQLDNAVDLVKKSVDKFD